MNKSSRGLKVLTFVIRWGVAALGIWYVFSQMSFHDQALALLKPAVDGLQPAPRWVRVQENSDESQFINAPDKAKLQVQVKPDGKRQYVLAVDLTQDLKTARRLLLADSPLSDAGRWVQASQTDYKISIPHPRVQIGIFNMVRQASSWVLLLALAVFPITIVITSLRWHELLKAVDVKLAVSRTFVLNMVGLFYNLFIPGTGGDLVKALYVAKQTHHRMRAVMSVLVDRVIGLLALIILGGVMAAAQWKIPTCREVAKSSAGLIGITLLGLLVFYVPWLRRYSGFDFIAQRLPFQQHVHQAIESMEIYGRRPGLVTAALISSFPVHIVVIVTAWLCGMAFHLDIDSWYYWMAVPVIVLMGAIPIAPQGAGVMEYFAIKLLEPQGVTVAQAFALTMSIRLLQLFWNLVGGIFVVRGGYHRPTESEERQIEAEDEDKGC